MKPDSQANKFKADDYFVEPYEEIKEERMEEDVDQFAKS